jgi:hypothetical protein
VLSFMDRCPAVPRAAGRAKVHAELRARSAVGDGRTQPESLRSKCSEPDMRGTFQDDERI